MAFTESVEEFHKFVSGLAATGGADETEDVMGGLANVSSTFNIIQKRDISWFFNFQAIDMDWKQEVRVLIHFGNAPPHGEDVL